MTLQGAFLSSSGGAGPQGVPGTGVTRFASGVLSADVPLDVSDTFIDILATDSLSVGEWLINATGAFSNKTDPGSNVVMLRVVEGTGTGTFAGPSVTEGVNDPSANYIAQLTVFCHLSVTVEGTFKLQGLSNDATGNSVLAKDDEFDTYSITGYTAFG